MAVRDDFAAGEVLAAADLNDTFASKLPYSYGTATPSTTDSGFLWYDSNSTPAQPVTWNGSAFTPLSGLTLVASEPMSAVSSISLNDCFTSRFTDYRLVIDHVGSGSGQDSIFRFRASGTDDSSANHAFVRHEIDLATGAITVGSTGTGASNTAFGRICRSENGQLRGLTIDVFHPRISGNMTSIVSQSSGSGLMSISMAGYIAVTTAFDGFSLIAATGNLTGRVRVYGYKD